MPYVNEKTKTKSPKTEKKTKVNKFAKTVELKRLLPDRKAREVHLLPSKALVCHLTEGQ